MSAIEPVELLVIGIIILYCEFSFANLKALSKVSQAFISAFGKTSRHARCE